LFVFAEILEPRYLLSLALSAGSEEYGFSSFDHDVTKSEYIIEDLEYCELPKQEDIKNITGDIYESPKHQDIKNITGDICESSEQEDIKNITGDILSKAIDLLLFDLLKKTYFYIAAPSGSTFFFKTLGYSLEIIIHSEFTRITAPYFNYVSQNLPDWLSEAKVPVIDFIKNIKTLVFGLDREDYKIKPEEFYFIEQCSVLEKLRPFIRITYFSQLCLEMFTAGSGTLIEAVFFYKMNEFANELRSFLDNSYFFLLETIESIQSLSIDFIEHINLNSAVVLVSTTIGWNLFSYEVVSYFDQASWLNVVIMSLMAPLFIDFYFIDCPCVDAADNLQTKHGDNFLYLFSVLYFHQKIIDHTQSNAYKITSVFTPVIFYYTQFLKSAPVFSAESYFCHYKECVEIISGSTCTTLFRLGNLSLDYLPPVIEMVYSMLSNGDYIFQLLYSYANLLPVLSLNYLSSVIEMVYSVITDGAYVFQLLYSYADLPAVRVVLNMPIFCSTFFIDFAILNFKGFFEYVITPTTIAVFQITTAAFTYVIIPITTATFHATEVAFTYAIIPITKAAFTYAVIPITKAAFHGTEIAFTCAIIPITKGAFIYAIIPITTVSFNYAIIPITKAVLEYVVIPTSKALIEYVIQPGLNYIYVLTVVSYSEILIPSLKYSCSITLRGAEIAIIAFKEWWEQPSDFLETVNDRAKKYSAKAVLIIYEENALNLVFQGVFSAYISSYIFMGIRNNFLIIMIEKAVLLGGKRFLELALAPHKEDEVDEPPILNTKAY
jgi:hypothetical protein